MTLYDRYLQGETTEVYNQLYLLGNDALSLVNMQQTDLILKETFERVKYNLGIIYNELRAVNYQFSSDMQYDWNIPLVSPDPNVDMLLSEVRRKLGDCGHIPLSLEYFYRIVGGCNFCWDWETVPDVPWEGADPIVVPPITTLLSEIIYDDYDGDSILLGGDYLQKDNVSGSCYVLELTPRQSVDSIFSPGIWNIPFVEYLRITFDNCGFAMADDCDYDDLDSFCDRIRPLLKKI